MSLKATKAHQREPDQRPSWQDERDRDEDDIPEPEPYVPVHTLE